MGRKKAEPKLVPYDERRRARIRKTTRYLYDLQKLRIAAGNRTGADDALLENDDLAMLNVQSEVLKGLEAAAIADLENCLKGIPIWETWLKLQKGIGPRLGGVLVSSIEIDKAAYVSQLWRFCGLAVDAKRGTAERRVKGEKAHFDPWLKSKLTMILGDCLMRSNSPWRKFYDNYKHRKQSQTVDECMLCNGSGRIKIRTKGKRGKACEQIEAASKSSEDAKECPNCKGTGGPTQWGKSDKHRHMAALRYMNKMFLAQLWEEWRKLENLPTRVSYAEEYLGKKHHEG